MTRVHSLRRYVVFGVATAVTFLGLASAGLGQAGNTTAAPGNSTAPAETSPGAAPASSGLTTASGVYTTEQSDRAAALYKRACSECHGNTLQGSANAPPLSGFPFTSYWAGKTLGDLWTVLHTMPADSPGSLTDAQYADLMALILSSNKYPSGTAEVPQDEAALAAITISAPAP